MTNNDTEIVSALRHALAAKVGRQRYELWFGGGEWLSVRDGAVVVAVPNQFYLDWLRNNFRKDLEDCCRDVFGTPAPLVFAVDERAPGGATAATAAGSSPASAPVPTDSAGAAPAADGGRSATAPSPSAAPSAPPAAAPGRRRFAHLESFVVGEGNRLAHATVRLVAESPGRISPLYLYGPTGVGKTHLLEGLWSAVKKARREACVVYLSAEQFTTHFVEAVRGSGLPNFRRKYRNLDLLLIDDVQFFRGKPRTVEELLVTLDTLQRDGRQLALAADAAPADLVDLGEEFTRRLQGGMVCRLESPDLLTRRGIVRQLAASARLPVPLDVQEFVAARLVGSARELAGALHRLQATAEALEQPIDRALAEEALSQMLFDAAPAVRMADIERAVCRVFRLEAEVLKSPRRNKEVSYPRMLAMWLARKHTRAALSEIGRYFGGRTHSTVVSAHKKVAGWMTAPEPLDLANFRWTTDEAIRRVEESLRVG